MKDNQFKSVSSNRYKELRAICINWCNKYCNNGTASLNGLRHCFSWKNACIVLCDNVYMSIPSDVFYSL